MAADELRQRIQNEIKRRGLNANAVSDRSGVPGPVLHRFLRQPDKTLEAETVRKLADFFDWPAVDVFRWADLLPPSETADPTTKLHEALYEGTWPEEVRRALYALAQATAPDASRAAWLKRVEEAWAFAEQVPAAYEGQPYSPESYRFRLRERFWQHLSGEVARAPEFQPGENPVDLRP